MKRRDVNAVGGVIVISAALLLGCTGDYPCYWLRAGEAKPDDHRTGKLIYWE